MNRTLTTIALAVAFIASVAAANWAVTAIPPASLGWGIAIPGGVWFVAVTLTIRDLLHHLIGARWTAGLVVAGTVISWPLAGDNVAAAATIAFLASGLLDQLFYALTLRLNKPRWVAIAQSNAVGLVADSLIFVTLAQDTLRMWGFEPWKLIVGQIIGKAAVTAVAVWVIKRRDARHQPTPAVVAA